MARASTHGVIVACVLWCSLIIGLAHPTKNDILGIPTEPLPIKLSGLFETMIISNKPEIAQYKQLNLNKTKYCVCKTLGPVLMLARMFGAFPVSWRHTTEKCIYEKSLIWLIYTGFVITFQIFVIFSNVNYSTLLNATLLVIIDNLTNLYYSHYVVLITLLGFFKFASYITALNSLASTLKDGVLCQSAMRRVVLLQYAIFASLALVATFQIILYIWLNNSTIYEANFTIMNILYRMFINFSFGLYAVLFTIFGLLIASLACFEKYTLNCLKYVPVHPLRDIDDSNNLSDFMGIIYYKLCTENHFITSKMLDLKPADVVENLRIYHEEFSLCIYSWNKSMDLLFLTHTVMELAVLIVDWYAVIAYLVYNFKAPIAATMNILNLFYVVSHTYGLFLFLKNCQALKNIIHGLVTFLLEYSTRITDPEEHQQVRFFIEKINNHRPFTASGVFTIDLGIAGPIAANILTYVLVALQFEIPKE